MTKFEQDKIGREEIVNRICLLVDNLQKDQHFCLALDGDWGSGKSFVLDMVEENLKQHREYVIIKYDAWANSFYSDPMIAILSCLIDGIEDKLYLVEQYAEKAKKAGKVTLNTLSKLSDKVNIFKSAIEGIKGIYNILHNPISMAGLEEFKSYQDLLKETKQVLNDITTTREYRGKQTKLIILVDEIDRCLPDEQLKILERLHHLFDVKNCAVICALNKKGIVNNFETTYGGNGEEYLRKFFDFNFYLDTSSEEYMQKLLEEFSKNLAKIKQLEKNQDEPAIVAYMCMAFGDKRVLDDIDNREVQRYYESLIKVCNDFGWERLPSTPYVFFIILGLFIRKNINSRFLEKNEIEKRQQSVDKWFRDIDIDPAEKRNAMPYHDYIEEYFGVERENAPEEFLQLWSGRGASISAEYIWYFNEIVYYSTGREFYGNSMRVFSGRPAVEGEICRELRRLIILYGGGEQK